MLLFLKIALAFRKRTYVCTPERYYEVGRGAISGSYLPEGLLFMSKRFSLVLEISLFWRNHIAPTFSGLIFFCEELDFTPMGCYGLKGVYLAIHIVASMFPSFLQR